MRLHGGTSKLACVGSTLLALALLPPLALAAHSSGKGPRHDLVAGTGKSEGFQVHVNAKRGGGGGATGHVFFHSDFAELDFTGRVTCVDVSGSDAVVSGVIEKFSPAAGMGGTFNVYIHDGGEGSSAADSWYAGLTFGEGLPAPTDCTSLPAVIPFEQGNFVVHDAS